MYVTFTYALCNEWKGEAEDAFGGEPERTIRVG